MRARSNPSLLNAFANENPIPEPNPIMTHVGRFIEFFQVVESYTSHQNFYGKRALFGAFLFNRSLPIKQADSFMKLTECPVRTALNVIGGKWKPVILYHLMLGKKRYSELQKLIPEASQKVLTQQLRELERDSIILRQVLPGVPQKVEYSMTSYGETLRSVLEALCHWGEKLGKNPKDRI